MLKIKPDPNCEYCHGTGTTYDSVPYGMGNTSMPSDCECVLNQLPEGEEDFELDLSDLKESEPGPEDFKLPSDSDIDRMRNEWEERLKDLGLSS